VRVIATSRPMALASGHRDRVQVGIRYIKDVLTHRAYEGVRELAEGRWSS